MLLDKVNNVNKVLLSSIVCFITTVHSNPLSKVIGWADVPGDNGINGTMVKTTTGGAGGKEVSIKSISELDNALKELGVRHKKQNDKTPVIYKLSGSYRGGPGMIKVESVSNVSIIGSKSTKITGTGFHIKRSYNIIIQNITFQDVSDDCINIDYQESHHIWVDHCNFSDIDIDSPPDNALAVSDKGHDGLLDIKNESSYITVSFCRFENHKKTMLIGHSADNKEDKDHLKVTVHHCWFGYTYSRNSRNRFGMIHLFNNFYNNTGSMLKTKKIDGIYEHGYAIASVCGARVVVENNYFHNVVWPTVVSRPISDPVWVKTYGTTENGKTHWEPTGGEPPGYITYRGTNIQTPKPGTLILDNYKIWPLDKTNPDPGNWNPWKDYGYSEDKIASLLTAAEDVPMVVAKAITGKEFKTEMIKNRRTSKIRQNKITRVNPKVFDLLGRKVTEQLFNGNCANGIFLFKNNPNVCFKHQVPGYLLHEVESTD